MITAAKLKAKTVKDLAAMAKKKKVPGWHSMRKDQLVRALVRHAKAAAARRAKSAAKKAANNGKSKAATKKKTRGPYAQRRLKQVKVRQAASKNLALKPVTEGNGCTKDRLVLMVRDPFWLHAYWELTQASVTRAKAALGQYWHAARPVLRVNEVARDGTTSSARQIVRDIEIHGAVNNWYIDVKDPPRSYQVEIGYAAGEKFFAVTRSNTVSTPRAKLGDSFDQNWAEVAKDFDRIYALSGGYLDEEGSKDLKEVFEEQLHRPMGDPMSTKFGLGASQGAKKADDLMFNVDTELIVHGMTEPDAHVTLRGEPVHLRKDGSFAVRFSLPNRRHVLPVVASSRDGVEQRTIVLAVDRNTKVMEPVIRDPGT